MDALAREGILFERYYASSNWTRPSTASLMTGLLPSEHEVETDGALLNGSYRTLSLSWPKSRDIGPVRLLEMAMRVEPLAFRVASIGFKTRAIIGKGCRRPRRSLRWVSSSWKSPSNQPMANHSFFGCLPSISMTLTMHQVPTRQCLYATQK